MDKTFSLDRVEEGVAVLIAQDGASFHVLRKMLPQDTREGDLVALQSGKWTILREETDELQAELFALQESLFDE